MAVITEGRRQYIVSTNVLLGWKRFLKRPDAKLCATLVRQNDNGSLYVRVGGDYYLIAGRKAVAQ